MAQWTIRCSGVGKRFGSSARGAVVKAMKDAARAVVLGKPSRAGADSFWAVDGVSLEVKQGECLAVMGTNGSGKSTLLRLINGILPPDAGKIEVRGRMAALIAVGAGFSPLLTGRENVFVNGALLGLTHAELMRKFDEIVSFSGLEKFIDLPVRHYSSGMNVRLGFAIAAMSSPDILLVDEVLAVGDLQFQKKCFDHVFRLAKDGTTIFLVSHSPGVIWALCDRGMLLDRGKMAYVGTAEETIRLYDEKNSEVAASSEISDRRDGLVQGTGAVRAQAMTVRASGGSGRDIDFGGGFEIETDLIVDSEVREPVLRFTLDAAHYRFILSLDNYEQGFAFDKLSPGTHHVRVTVPRTNLMPGAYRVNFSVGERHSGQHLFIWHGAANFVVKHPRDRFLVSEPNAVLFVDSQFEVESAIDVKRARIA